MFITRVVCLLIFSALCATENSGASSENNFLRVQKEVESSPYWSYPYPEIIDYLLGSSEESILIFSYGSLMDAASASRTLSEGSMATRRPAIAYGVKRLFDRDVAIKEGSKWKTPNHPDARGMLNVMPSSSPEDFINGVLVEVSLEDIPQVLFREEGYDLLPVVVQEWEDVNSASEHSYRIAYTFYAPQGSEYTSENILPRPGYYELARNASLQYGQIYYQLWLKTTYCADGITPIYTWEQQVERGEEQTQTRGS